MSNLEVKINVDPKNELHEKKEEPPISSPQQVPDNTAAAGNGSNEEKDKNRKSPPPQDQDNDKNIHEKLRKAAFGNEWFTAYWEIFGGDGKKILKYATASLTDQDDNALHIAVEAGSSMFIHFLLNNMTEKDLEMRNSHKNTAFFLAAKHGRLKCAKQMLDKNKELLVFRGEADLLPIQIAAQRGRKKMVKFLYRVHEGTELTRLNQEDCEKLLPNLICRADLIDVTWKVLEKNEGIVTKNMANGRRGEETFLHVLAQTNLMSSKLSNQNKGGLFQRFFDKFSHKNKFPHEKLPKEALDLLKHLLEKINTQDHWMYGVIERAVKHENVAFLSLIICKYSQLMNCTEEDGKTAGLIFSNAISKRQKDIFQLRESLNPLCERQVIDYKDCHQNNILHLAGKLSPPEQLDAISGVALQLQEELKWFEEVSIMADASKAHEKNKDGKTPKALFDEEHKKLKESGEQWMKDTANSCMIVAALIATVVFTAAFTVPGGTNEESGMPRFSNQLSFRIFVFADATSLVLSVYSLLIFLDIHTSRYAYNDFLLELPKKLVVGLLTLLLSIAAMMVVFCTSIFFVIEVDNIWVRILLSVSAFFPVLHFAKMKRELLFDVVHKTSEINSILKEGKRMKGKH
ncbi:ankyrin repeat-containing protein At5g02620-like [Mangifera indica]|uniref:ankyrin repeat-containing protein At5g02620-like n=1 Tax=Mangifera indica TaxID=29780 RepID=UPI001CF9AE9F|nr:ankyrin repeat-containing protein At5g02620-like [Mangifera indica]